MKVHVEGCRELHSVLYPHRHVCWKAWTHFSINSTLMFRAQLMAEVQRQGEGHGGKTWNMQICSLGAVISSGTFNFPGFFADYSSTKSSPCREGKAAFRTLQHQKTVMPELDPRSNAAAAEFYGSQLPPSDDVELLQLESRIKCFACYKTKIGMSNKFKCILTLSTFLPQSHKNRHLHNI